MLPERLVRALIPSGQTALKCLINGRFDFLCPAMIRNMAWRKICPRKKCREKDKKSINILGDSNIFPNFAGSKGLFLFLEKRAAIRVN